MKYAGLAYKTFYEKMKGTSFGGWGVYIWWEILVVGRRRL